MANVIARAVELLLQYWGKQIRRARGDRSQVWLARQVGVDQSIISRIESGAYRLGPELMVGIALALEVPVGDLFSFPPGIDDIAKHELAKRERVSDPAKAAV